MPVAHATHACGRHTLQASCMRACLFEPLSCSEETTGKVFVGGVRAVRLSFSAAAAAVVQGRAAPLCGSSSRGSRSSRFCGSCLYMLSDHCPELPVGFLLHMCGVLARTCEESVAALGHRSCSCLIWV